MFILLLSFLAVAAILPALAKYLGRRVFYVAAGVPAAACVWGVWAYGKITVSGPINEQAVWVPQLGLTLGLRFYGFAFLMLSLVAGIGVLVFVYSASYFHGEPIIGRFAATLLLFSGSMLGLVLADNLLALFLFWELTSISSYLLISIEDEKVAARSGALQALLITGMGGLAMLGGFVLLGEAAGTYSMSELLSKPPSGSVVTAALVLVLIGAFTKSAQVPFHSWLPRAMNAPTPVSSYLHSATMVTAGVYLVARFTPAFAEYSIWRPLVIFFGLSSMLIGAYRSLRQHDLKLLLAYGTISQLGLMMLLFGVGTKESIFAGCTLLLAHGIFKAALFMLVGIIDHQTHTRDIRVLGGLGAQWPVVAVTAGVVAASMAGIPPLFGFLAKEEALAAVGETGFAWGAVVVAGVVVGSMLTVAYSARFLWGAFGPQQVQIVRDQDYVGEHAPQPAKMFVAPVILLAGLSILFGLLPSLINPVVSSAYESLVGSTSEHHLALWHGFTQALALSALVVIAGGTLFWQRERVESIQDSMPRLPSAQHVYDRTVKGLLVTADAVTGFVQHGSLPIYLGIILLTMIVLPGVPLLSDGVMPTVWLADSPMQVFVGFIMIVCACAAAVARRRFAAVLLVGAVGYGMAALFVIQGAPDLAITQLLIETLGVAVFVLAFRHLPADFPRPKLPRTQFLRIAIAVLSGLFIFGFTLFAIGAKTGPTISGEYLDKAYSEGGGRNVVNVIVVDFRGFDTLGEIVVLAVAALGVAAIVRAKKPPTAVEEELHNAKVES
ncbi:MAG: hydrogen gas-evolving membrane-bound hydrogenase subunit E [Microthrixaceae bacterium]